MFVVVNKLANYTTLICQFIFYLHLKERPMLHLQIDMNLVGFRICIWSEKRDLIQLVVKLMLLEHSESVSSVVLVYAK